MRHIHVLAMLGVMALSTVALGQVPLQEGGSSIQKQVTHLRDQWLEAERTGNRAVLDQVLAGDCVVMTPQGIILSKAQMLKRAENASVKFDALRPSDTHVRVYSGVAILTDHVTVSAQENGRHIGGQFRFIRIFVKQHGAWQVVMAQGARLKSVSDQPK